MSVPPDGSAAVTRTRAARAVPAAVATVAVCLVVVAAARRRACARGFGPQLRLDAAVSEALYVGDHRAVALNDLLAGAHRARAVRGSGSSSSCRCSCCCCAGGRGGRRPGWSPPSC